MLYIPLCYLHSCWAVAGTDIFAAFHISYIKNIFHFPVELTRSTEKMGCKADLSASWLKTAAEDTQALLAYSSLSARGKNKARD